MGTKIMNRFDQTFVTSLAAALVCTLLSLTSTASAAPLTFSGITFDDGALAFADEVVSYVQGANVGFPNDDPLEALGTPDLPSGPGVDFVSLGNFQTSNPLAATLVLRFTDNSLTTSGDATKDLHIFEIGAVVERMDIFIAKTLATPWIFVGRLEGKPTSVDIDAVTGVLLGELFSYVKIVDGSEGGSGFPFGGADIDAVGAISSGAAVPTIPLPAALPLLLTGLISLGRRFAVKG
jgi:hypothetical protein